MVIRLFLCQRFMCLIERLLNMRHTIKLGNREIPFVQITEEEQIAFSKDCQLDGAPPIEINDDFDKDTNMN